MVYIEIPRHRSVFRSVCVERRYLLVDVLALIISSLYEKDLLVG